MTNGRKVVGQWAIALASLVFGLVLRLGAGIYLISYEDAYDESKGPYFSWESMEWGDRVAVVVGDGAAILVLLFSVYAFYRAVRETLRLCSAG